MLSCLCKICMFFPQLGLHEVCDIYQFLYIKGGNFVTADLKCGGKSKYFSLLKSVLHNLNVLNFPVVCSSKLDHSCRNWSHKT